MYEKSVDQDKGLVDVLSDGDFRKGILRKQSELEYRMNMLEGAMVAQRQREMDKLHSIVAVLLDNGKSIPANSNLKIRRN